jgi:hypothetical protein
MIRRIKTALMILLGVGSFLAASFPAEGTNSKRPVPATDKAVPTETPLYMHLLAPRYYTDPPTPARRIVTTRIYLSQEFGVILDGDPNTTLSGRVDKDGGKFVAHQLQGVSNGTMNMFDGEMEFEKPIHSTRGMFSGGIFSAIFVLSTNADCTPLLRKIDPEAFKSAAGASK